MKFDQEDGALDTTLATQERKNDDMDPKIKKYLRGEGANLEVLQDKKLKGQLAVREDLYGRSAKSAVKIEKWLLPSEGGFLEAEGVEKTWRIRQEAIAREVDIASSRNQYDVVLPVLGPYNMDFTPSGRYMALGGRKGHLAIIDMKSLQLIKEFQVRETVRDVVFLHNELFFAAAQKKYTYIYSREGIELHCLKEHGVVTKLQFLKNHFLLASRNKDGRLHYQDVTTGEIIANHHVGDGRCDTMRVSPVNGVIALGHTRGAVTLWKPTSSNPLVKMLCHHGAISSIAFHPDGSLMATSGKEGKIKLWDLRKFERLHSLPFHAKTLDFSQKGLLAAATGSFVQIWRDVGSQYTRYMSHSMAKGYQVGEVVFRPYEDVLGIGHSSGWSSILVPGSGEPNFDTWVANPFETAKQRREKEVHMLLDKLPPETIMLDPSKIGTVFTRTRREKSTKQERDDGMEVAVAGAKEVKVKKKTKGRSKTSKMVAKKKENVSKTKAAFLKEIKEDGYVNKKARLGVQGGDLPKALQRFVHKNPA